MISPETVASARLSQEKSCESMTLDQLRAELSTLRCLLTNVCEEFRDREETIFLIMSRLDVVNNFIVGKENAPL